MELLLDTANLEAIRKPIGEQKQLHIQVTARSCEEMLKEAEVITARLGKDVYIKVPVTEEGVKAMKGNGFQVANFEKDWAGLYGDRKIYELD